MKNYILPLVLVSFLACCAGKKSEQNALETPKTVNPKTETVAVVDKPQTEATKVGMQALIEAYLKKSDMKITFVKKDFVNGYAEFRFTESAVQPATNCQFAYYTTQNDREILAVTVPQCMQACGTALTFYEMTNAELTENQGMIENMTDMNQFNQASEAHMEAKMTTEEKQKEANGEMALYDNIISLPQQGTTIKVIKRSTRNQTLQNVAQLQFNEKTGKFTFIKL